MAATLGSGEHRYRVIDNWAKLPDGWQLTDVASVAVDRKDCIYVFIGSVDGGYGTAALVSRIYGYDAFRRKQSRVGERGRA